MREGILQPDKKMRVLVVLGEGGHTIEMIRLLDLLGPAYDYHYLLVKEETLSEKKIHIPGPIYRCNRPQWKVENRWRVLARYIRLSWQSLIVLLRAQPKAILHSGPGIAIPVATLGKLLGAKVIYVENGARVHHPSLSGRWMYRIADLFFVQWPELQAEAFPEAIYAGSLHG